MGRRVVITGLGALTPIGEDVTSFWDNLKKGTSGAAQITKFDTDKFKAKFACELKSYDPTLFFDRKEEGIPSQAFPRFKPYVRLSPHTA